MATVTSATGTQTNAASTATSQSLASFSNNFDNFLTLLTSQLKNQDPLSPMNATEFTTQLVQFTGVEQMIQQNQNLNQLISLQTQGQVTNSLGYIGRTVEASGTTVQMTGSSATFNYSVGAGATTASITVKNASGQTVFTGTVPANAGAQSFTWDGRNNAGVQQPDGNYTYSVNARSPADQAVTVTTKLSGTVASVESLNGQILLHLATGQVVPVSDVLAVRSAS